MHALELLFVVALILYSFVIWYHRIKQRLCLWMVLLFGIGLGADAGGTLFLCVMNAERWTLTLHTISGLASLLVMTVHFLWALLAMTAHGKFESCFKRYSLAAWGLWLVAFISGIPLG